MRRAKSGFFRYGFFAIVAAGWLFLSPGPARAQEHVAPDPPQQTMPAMSDAGMKSAMEMDDSACLAMFRLDEFERGFGNDANATVWNAQAWYGGDFDKLWLRTEGERETERKDARIEALWDHAFASHWDWQLGLRRDFGSAAGQNVSGRSWGAFGVQGLAPYWFSIEATAYLGGNGRTAARFRAEYDVLLTQRLVLQPEFEANLYDRNDRERAIASGLSAAELGLRLRYEVRREFAPYVGIVRSYRQTIGDASFPARERGASATRFVIGFRLWL